MGHWVMGQYEEAIEDYKNVLHRKHMSAHIHLTASYSLLGPEGEARAEATGDFGDWAGQLEGNWMGKRLRV